MTVPYASEGAWSGDLEVHLPWRGILCIRAGSSLTESILGLGQPNAEMDMRVRTAPMAQGVSKVSRRPKRLLAMIDCEWWARLQQVKIDDQHRMSSPFTDQLTTNVEGGDSPGNQIGLDRAVSSRMLLIAHRLERGRQRCAQLLALIERKRKIISKSDDSEMALVRPPWAGAICHDTLPRRSLMPSLPARLDMIMVYLVRNLEQSTR
jgi:hypothetical protein